MIVNLIIKYKTQKQGETLVYKAEVSKSITTNTFVDRVICSCGVPYPKIVELTKDQHIVPVEGTIRQEVNQELQADTPTSLSSNIVSYITSLLNRDNEQIRHGIEASVSCAHSCNVRCPT